MLDAGMDETSVMVQSGNRTSSSLQHYRTNTLVSSLAASAAFASHSTAAGPMASLLGKRSAEVFASAAPKDVEQKPAPMSSANSFSFGNISGGVVNITIGHQHSGSTEVEKK
jgi:hypothetical protein